MAIVGGIDVHRRQLTFDYCDRATGELCRGRIPQRTGKASGPGCRSCLRGVISRSKAARVGAILSRNSRPPASWHTSPNRLTLPPCGATSSGPRPTELMPVTLASCSCPARFPRAGSRQLTFSRHARPSGCTRTSPTSGERGPSESTRRCSIKASRPSPVRSPATSGGLA